jgi:serine/threonine protein kinase/formylglycine-generating enzyme required for sulfatase activity
MVAHEPGGGCREAASIAPCSPGGACAEGRLNDVLRTLLEDLERRVLRSLNDYQAMAPGLELEIAEVYADVIFESAPREGDPSTAPAEPGGRAASAPALRSLGSYRILAELGRGGQGVVYLAIDSRLGRRVALKLLAEGPHFSDAALRRFRREAEITSRLDHPGLCTVYEADVDQGRPYIAMRLIQGRPFSERIRGRAVADEKASISRDVQVSSRGARASAARPSAPEIAARRHILEQVARALHTAHTAHVIHRDLKPGNILVAENGQPVIVDFGLARELDREADPLTLTGQVFGTPHYMSPEQLAGAGPLDARTDVFSLGVTLYEALTLRRPFTGVTHEALVASIRSSEPDDPRRWNPALSKDVSIVVGTCLEKQRDWRYATAWDLAEDLRRARTGEPILARPISRCERLWRWFLKNQALGISLAAVFVSLALGFSVSLALLAERNAALVDSGAALRQKQESLDVLLVRELRLRAQELWPRRSVTVPAMTHWIEETESVLARLPRHEAALTVLRARALPARSRPPAGEERLRRAAYPELYDELDQHRGAVLRAQDYLEACELHRAALLSGGAASPSEARESIAAETIAGVETQIQEYRESIASHSDEIVRLESDPRLTERFTYDFSDAADRTQHALLSEVVREARTLPPLLGEIRARLELTATLRRQSIEAEEARAAWDRCVADVSRPESPYKGLKLAPIEGLLPLGIDAVSGFWELWHLESGERPPWKPRRAGTSASAADARGAVEIEEESGIVLVLLPGDTFQMGTTPKQGEPNPAQFAPETPCHAVLLTPFLLGKYEVTQAQWLRLMLANPSARSRGWDSLRKDGRMVTARHPVEQVSWNDAVEACRRGGLALPTEAQWEYGCRAGSSTWWWCGDDPVEIDSLAAGNIADSTMKECQPGVRSTETVIDGFVVHAPAGSFTANAFGLHDVIGNVWEWCRDGYGAYRVSKHRGPRNGDDVSDQGDERIPVLRGGSFLSPAEHARSAYRHRASAAVAGHDFGLRVAFSLATADR